MCTYLRSDLEWKDIARNISMRAFSFFFSFLFSKTSSKIPLLLRFSLPIFNRSRETHPSLAMIRVYFSISYIVYSARSKEESCSCTILRFCVYLPTYTCIYAFINGDVKKLKLDLLCISYTCTCKSLPYSILTYPKII